MGQLKGMLKRVLIKEEREERESLKFKCKPVER